MRSTPRSRVEIQRGTAERKAIVPAAQRIGFRIGVNVADIIHHEKDIFGNGVNMAARLEGLASRATMAILKNPRRPVRQCGRA